MTETTRFRYWAFLSYSSRDAGAATRLHKQLETYRLPRSLVGRPGRDGAVPRRIFPVFRDRDELPLSADLGASIRDALRASRYLIVLCSPRSAQSRWVNEEVGYFKALGREDRILAIILDGEPNASDHGLDPEHGLLAVGSLGVERFDFQPFGESEVTRLLDRFEISAKGLRVHSPPPRLF